jgi:hypothetical protein
MTGGPGYVLEDSPEGRTLVVTGRWSNDAARALARGEADGLVLNYARGFCEGSLDLLDSGWPLRRLDVLDRSIVDLDPIGRLGGLRSSRFKRLRMRRWISGRCLVYGRSPVSGRCLAARSALSPCWRAWSRGCSVTSICTRSVITRRWRR